MKKTRVIASLWFLAAMCWLAAGIIRVTETDFSFQTTDILYGCCLVLAWINFALNIKRYRKEKEEAEKENENKDK